MAKYFSLSASTFADNFKAALESYYGDEVLIESASGTTIIFKVPAVCDKVLKFTKNNGGFVAYAGDTSSSMTQFSTAYSSGSMTAYHLILADAFILLDCADTGSYRNSALIAKLTNGRHILMGGTVSNSSSYTQNNKCCFTDTMTLRPIRMICPCSIDARSNGKMCLLPSFITDEREVELNADGTFASIPGVWLASTTGAPVVGGNYYLSQSALRGLDAEGTYCTAQKYIELDVE